MNIGDKVYHEFRRGVITEDHRPGRITVEVGSFLVGTQPEYCFPDEPGVAKISDQFDKLYQQIHKLDLNCLNYPDIHGRMVRLWEEACRGRQDRKLVHARLAMAKVFTQRICRTVASWERVTVAGVRLLR
ncbi:MAG: hypothetical protein ABFE07_28415 [Armatimonadia bacterium]